MIDHPEQLVLLEELLLVGVNLVESLISFLVQYWDLRKVCNNRNHNREHTTLDMHQGMYRKVMVPPLE